MNLALDLVDWGFGVFDVGHVGRGDAAGIGGYGAAVGEGAHGGEGGENGAVYEARRGDEAEPPVDEDEHGGGVDVRDAQNDDAHRQ